MTERLQRDPQFPLDERAFRARSRELWTQAAAVTREIQAPPICRVDLNGSNQTITVATLTTLALLKSSSYAIDTHGWFDESTYKYTPKRSGYYHVDLAMTLSKSTLDLVGYVIGRILKSGASQSQLYWQTLPSSAIVAPLTLSQIVYCDGISDYLTFAIEYQSSTGLVVDGNAVRTYAAIHYLGDKQAS